MKIGRSAAAVTSPAEGLSMRSGFVGIDLDRRHVAGAVEVELRLGHRHEHDRESYSDIPISNTAATL
jgi:hypothetical protein